MEAQVKRVNAIFPWFLGFNSDLLFYIAVNTLFLTVVKEFGTFEISLLSTVSLVVCLIFEKYILKLIKKIGNTASMRLGTGMLVIASLLITFGNNLFMIIIGYIFYEAAWFFKSVENVILKNNMIVEGTENQYIKVKSKGNMIYAVITAVIALISGFLFNLDHYLPMYLCILSALFCFLLSFYLKEFKVEKQTEIKNKKKIKLKLSSIVWLTIFVFAIFYASLNFGQSYGKLLIQYELTDIYGIGIAATALSVIIFISRLARIFGNMIFNKVYNIFKDKVSILISLFLLLSFVFIILGFYIQNLNVLKFVLMSAGFFIILAIRDPFKIYIQDLILKLTSKKNQETATYYLEVIRKGFSAVLKVGITMVLTKFELNIVIFILFVFSIICFSMTIRLYKLVTKREGIEDVTKELNYDKV